MQIRRGQDQMTPATTSAKSAEHYTWGSSRGTDCDGWHLLRTPDLSVIEESMPPGTSEIRHSHVRARQFFFVLEGELTMEVEGSDLLLRAREGIEIRPGQWHRAVNQGESAVRMLVVSQPPSHGDRVIA
jgi:mannose-6-phosphate isomerase-like protein (cupin superfamily)